MKLVEPPVSEGRMQSARLLSSQLSPIAELLATDHPAALKYALALLDLIRPDTRLPIVKLDEAAKPAVEAAIACLCGENLIQPSPCFARHAGPGPRM